MILFWISLFIFHLHCVKTFSWESKLIKSYIEKQTFPTRVIFYSCNNQVTTFKFTKEMVKLQVATTTVTNISKLKRLTFLPHALLITNSECEDFNVLMETANNFQLLQAPYKWLIFDNNPSKIPSNLSALINSNFAVARNVSYGMQVLLWFKYSKHDDSFAFNDIGLFSEKNGFLYYNHFSAYNRTNLERTNIPTSYVVTNPAYPFDIVDFRYRHIDSVSKISYILVMYALEILNCTPVFIQRKTWGYKLQNKTFYEEGMLGDLQNGTAELAGTVALYSILRMDVIEYISATSGTDLKFILKAPPLSYVQNLFVLPFEVNVWFSLYCVTALSIFLLYIIALCEHRNNEAFINANNPKILQPGIFNATMAQVSIVTQQGSDEEPNSNAGRIAFFVMLLVMMFIYTSYSAKIVVLLQSTSNTIKTVNDLLNSKISLGSEDMGYNRFFLSVEQEPIRKAIYDTKIAVKGQKPNFMTVEEGVKKLREEFFGFHVETTSGYKIIMDTFQEQEKCGLIEVDFLNAITPSLSVRKNSPYKKVVQLAMRKLYETGIRHRNVNRLYFKKPQCTVNGGSFVNVGLIDVYFPFMMFSAGAAVSVVLLVIEVFLKKCLKLKKNFKK